MRRVISIALLFSIIIAGALLGGCRGFPLIPQAEETPTPEPTPPPEITVEFQVDKDNIVQGEAVTLTWNVQNAAAVVVDGQGVDHQGSREERPDNTHTYTLRAERPGSSVERQLVVIVEPAAPTPEPEPEPTPTPPGPECETPYVVQPCDTLHSIATRHNISVEAIIECNALPNPNCITIGQIIMLPSTVEGLTPPSWCAEVHVVQPGETLFSIAQKYGVPMQVILAYNTLLDPTWIWVGQAICIPSPECSGAVPVCPGQ